MFYFLSIVTILFAKEFVRINDTLLIGLIFFVILMIIVNQASIITNLMEEHRKYLRSQVALLTKDLFGMFQYSLDCLNDKREFLYYGQCYKVISNQKNRSMENRVIKKETPQNEKAII